MHNTLKLSLFFSSLVALSCNYVFASPEGGVIAAGDISIVQDAKTTQITQTTNTGVIDWNSFNVKSDENVNFIQPNSDAMTFNHIHDVNPSTIEGQITANGHITLINPNGVIFSKNSKIDVAGIVASAAPHHDDSTLNITDLNVDASIVKNGDIFIGENGEAFMISSNVEHNNVDSLKNNKRLFEEVFTPSGDIIYLVNGDNQDQKAWYYIKINPAKLPAFLEELSTTHIELSVYGEVIESGWGEQPPIEIRQKIEDMY